MELKDKYYISGSGNLVLHYSTFINLELVKSKLRPSFMIQWIDFMFKEDFFEIIKYIHGLGFKLIKINQGIIIYIDKYILKYIYLYNKNIDCEYNLGKVLGYPAAGDIENHNKKFISIYSFYNNQYHQIMVNAYSNKKSKNRFIDFYHTIKNNFKEINFILDDGLLNIKCNKVFIHNENYDNYRKFNKFYSSTYKIFLD